MNIGLIISTLNTVLSVAVIVVIGFVGVKAGILGERTLKELSAYLIYIAVPCTVISKLYSAGDVMQAFYGVGISAIVQIVAVGIGCALTRVFDVPEGRRGINAASFAISNSGFIGLPIVTMLFGDAAKNVAIYYIVANNIVFWTIGAYLIKEDAKAMGTLRVPPKQSIKERIKSVNPPIATFFVMLFVVALKLPLPEFFISAVEIIDETTAPAAIIFCGTVLGGIGLKNMKWKKGFSLIMLGRYVVTPLLMVGFFMLIPADDLLQKVFIVQSAMPVVTLVEVGAKKYGGDVEYASLSFIYSLFILAVTLPITYYLLMSF